MATLNIRSLPTGIISYYIVIHKEALVKSFFVRTAEKKCYLLSLKTRVTYYRKPRASLRAFVKACRRSSLAACKACQRENRVGMGMAATRGWGDAGIAACGNRFDTGRRQRKNRGMRDSRRLEDAAARGQRRSVASKKQKKELPQSCGSSENSYMIKPTHAPVRRKGPSMHMS